VNQLLAKYIPLVDFLAQVLGPDAEVVLHDVEDMDRSVVAIRNGQVSGRGVGSPATNMVLKIVQEGRGSKVDYLTNYKGLATDGRALRSSTYFIHDEKNILIGLLCINIDTSKLEFIRDYLDRLLPAQSATSEEAVEHFSSSVEELAFDSISTVIKSTGTAPRRMLQEEKIAVVRRLDQEGIFLLKGAISRVASELEVSEATLYRYLTNVRKSAN
jgi:predicted transcriptional regulator YheO